MQGHNKIGGELLRLGGQYDGAPLAEVVAALLGGSQERRRRVAAQLIEEVGGDVRALVELANDDRVSDGGGSSVEASRIAAAVELGRRYLVSCKPKGEDVRKIRDSEEAAQYFHARLFDLRREVLAGLFLDNRQRLLKFEILFTGGRDSCSVDSGYILRRCLELRANALIIAHNHPSGVLEVSYADQRLTDRLSHALELIRVSFAGHILIVGNEWRHIDPNSQ